MLSMLRAVMLSVVILSVTLLSVIMQIVITLSDMMLGVVFSVLCSVFLCRV